MRKILLIMATLTICAYAQFTKVLEKPASESPYIYAYDAEHLNDTYSPYFAYQTGSSVSILNLNSLAVEFTTDISPIKTANPSATHSSIFFYKNLLQSDGKWTALVYSLNAPLYTVGLLTDGKYTSTSIVNYASMGLPTLRPAGNKIYLIATTETSTEVYLVRNNVPTTSAIWDKSKYMAVLEKLNTKTGSVNHFNTLGQQIPEIQYQELQKFMKKTYFENNN